MGDIMISRDAESNVVAIGKVQLRVFLFLHATYCMCFYINAHHIGLCSCNQQSAETDPGFVCRISLFACLCSCGWTVVCKDGLFVGKVLFS